MDGDSLSRGNSKGALRTKRTDGISDEDKRFLLTDLILFCTESLSSPRVFFPDVSISFYFRTRSYLRLPSRIKRCRSFGAAATKGRLLLRESVATHS